MGRLIDIHGFEDRLWKARSNVEKSNPISERNAELIGPFADACAAEGLSKGWDH